MLKRITDSAVSLRTDFLTLIVLLLLTVSCSLSGPELPVFPDDNDLDESARSRLTALLKNRAEQVTSYRALTRTRIEEGNERHSYRNIFVYKSPDKLRFELLPVNTAYSLSVLVSGNGSATFISVPDKLAGKGKDSRNLLKRAIGVPLSEIEIAGMLSGIVFSENLEEYRMVLSEDGSLVYLVSPDFDYIWHVDIETGELSALQVRSEGELLVDVKYHAFRSYQEVSFPSRFEMWLPEESMKFTYTVSGLVLNRPVEDELFTLSIPEGYSVYTFD